MTIEVNKRAVVAFNSHFERSEIDAILATMTDDCQWWVLGKPELFPVTGTLPKTEYGAVMREVHASLQGGMRMDVVGMVAEGDQVAAELRAHAITNTGRTYDNRYHMLYTLHDGKIAAAREYTDLMTIQDVFYSSPTEAAASTPGDRTNGAAGEAPPITPTQDGPADPGEAKRLVASYLELFGSGNISAVLDMMTDDAIWWVNGRPDLYAGAGSWTKAEMANVWHGLYARLDGNLAMDPTGMVAESNRVAAEVRSKAVTTTGKTYANDYHMLFVLRDRKIAQVREYTDLLHAAAVFS